MASEKHDIRQRVLLLTSQGQKVRSSLLKDLKIPSCEVEANQLASVSSREQQVPRTGGSSFQRKKGLARKPAGMRWLMSQQVEDGL
eukprot:1144144-Pelagomonas_calceolata.AAC.2